MRKAKGYRSKHTGGSYGNSNSRPFGGKAGDHYKLSTLGNSNKQDDFANDRSNSEENILASCPPNNSIVKSVTYTVQVDDDGDSASSRKGPGHPAGVAM